MDQSISEGLFLPYFICPKSLDYELSGDHVSQVWKYMEIRISKCSGKATCKTDAEIDAIINELRFSLALSSYFFDSNDYDSPLKVTIANDFNWNLLSNMHVNKHIKLKVNQVQDYTSIFYPSSIQDYTYYSVDNVIDRLGSENPSKRISASIFLELDNRYDFTERKVYNFYDMFGQIGGVLGLLVPLGATFVHLFSENTYKMTLLSHFYKVEEKHTLLKNIM